MSRESADLPRFEIAARIIVSGLAFGGPASTERIDPRLRRPSQLSNMVGKLRTSIQRPPRPAQPAVSRKGSFGDDSLGLPTLPYENGGLSSSSLSLASKKEPEAFVFPPRLPPRTEPFSHRVIRGQRQVPQVKPSVQSLGAAAEAPFRLAIARQVYMTAGRQAYLRHSWNRIDLIAVLGFWISVVLATAGWEASAHVYIFRAISVLRAARLLTITAGMTVRSRTRAV